MRVNLYLFKKDISPKNLPIFTSAEDRETYFSANNADKAYTNISYNGTRNIRLNVNAFEANLDYYNYARINWIDKEDVERNYYCFIDIVKYVNDNVSELQLTMDYVTTYYFDIKLSEFILKQCSMQNDMKNRRGVEANEDYRLYYENKIPCVYKPTKAIPLCHDIQLPDTTCKLKWLIVNVAPSSSDSSLKIYKNNGTEVLSIITPVVYNSDTEVPFRSTQAFIRENNNTDRDCDITSILKYYDGRILNISMIDNPFVDSEIVVLDINEDLPTTLRENAIYVKKENFEIYSVYISRNLKLPTTKFLYLIAEEGDSNAFIYMLSHINYSIFFYTNGIVWNTLASDDYKYASIIKNGNEEVLQFSPLDFDASASDKIENIRISLKINVDPIYPNNLMINVKRGGLEPLNKKLKNFIIPPPISGIQFDQTKWGEYYVQNSASVNDGLATKHKYDLENADLQRKGSYAQTAAKTVSTISSAIANFASGDVAKGVSSLSDAVAGVSVSIAATQTAYMIAENNIEKEKELLQLSWNDIKASPNSMYNYGAGNNIISLIDFGYVLYNMEPVDMNNKDMKIYHMIYGFKINRKFGAINKQEFKGINDIMLMYENVDSTLTDIKYKFIRLDSDFVIDNLPLTVRKMLKDIFADGVKFYNKDNMLISVNPNFNNYID